MGKKFYALVIAGFVLVIGLSMFPSIKETFGFNSTTGFGYVLNAVYTGLPYALGFFILYGVWKAARGNNGS